MVGQNNSNLASTGTKGKGKVNHSMKVRWNPEREYKTQNHKSRNDTLNREICQG
jgi:hypothetical protein